MERRNLFFSSPTAATSCLFPQTQNKTDRFLSSSIKAEESLGEAADGPEKTRTILAATFCFQKTNLNLDIPSETNKTPFRKDEETRQPASPP